MTPMHPQPNYNSYQYAAIFVLPVSLPTPHPTNLMVIIISPFFPETKLMAKYF